MAHYIIHFPKNQRFLFRPAVQIFAKWAGNKKKYMKISRINYNKLLAFFCFPNELELEMFMCVPYMNLRDNVEQTGGHRTSECKVEWRLSIVKGFRFRFSFSFSLFFCII